MYIKYVTEKRCMLNCVIIKSDTSRQKLFFHCVGKYLKIGGKWWIIADISTHTHVRALLHGC